MTFLELAKRLRQECGIPGSGPNSLSAQTGELKRVVDWISAAYIDIQSIHTTWDFLRKEFSFSCVNGTENYGVTKHGLTDLAEWDVDTVRCYLTESDEQFLEFYPWEQFRDTWKIGTNRTRTGRPICFSVKPDNSLTFDCVPDAAYTISGEYYSTPVEMGTDAQSPIFPAQFHLAIVFRAMMYAGAYLAEPDKYSFGDSEFRRLIGRMEMSQLPPVLSGEPLA